MSSVIVRPDGPQLEEMAELLAAGKLDIAVAATFGLGEAESALATARGGRGGAVVLLP